MSITTTPAMDRPSLMKKKVKNPWKRILPSLRANPRHHHLNQKECEFQADCTEDLQCFFEAPDFVMAAACAKSALEMTQTTFFNKEDSPDKAFEVMFGESSLLKNLSDMPKARR